MASDLSQLAESLRMKLEALASGPDSPARPAWGRNAAESPSDYWHWRDAWSQHSATDHREPAPWSPATAGPLLSVLLSMVGPPNDRMVAGIRSVATQAYGRWELIVCGDDPVAVVDGTRAGLTAEDQRITVLTGDVGEGAAVRLNRMGATATGEFVVLLDSEDHLEPDSLSSIARAISMHEDVDVIYSDEDGFEVIEQPIQPRFKPDWDPELLLSTPYLGHALAIRRSLVERVGGFRPSFEGGHVFDLMLRATESARRVVHLPRVLYHRSITDHRSADGSEARNDAARRAVEDTVSRRTIDADVVPGTVPGAVRLRRRITGSPTVSVIIPFRDQSAMTLRCIDSLEQEPGYPITEIVLVDNGSVEPETVALRRLLEARSSTRVLDQPGAFNWSGINNVAAATCESDLLLFLNNDIEAASSGWLQVMVAHAQRPEVGAVGARLTYPGGALQHAGIVLGVGGIVSHIFGGKPPDREGYLHLDRLTRSYSAVTGACMLVRRGVFEEIGGFDELLPVAFNDVDFCLRLGDAGYRVLYTPDAELTHYESISRGLSGYSADFGHFLTHWWGRLQSEDPFYNPNLGRETPWCALRMPGEDEEWFARIGALVPASPSPPSSEPDP